MLVHHFMLSIYTHLFILSYSSLSFCFFLPFIGLVKGCWIVRPRLVVDILRLILWYFFIGRHRRAQKRDFDKGKIYFWAKAMSPNEPALPRTRPALNPVGGKVALL